MKFPTGNFPPYIFGNLPRFRGSVPFSDIFFLPEGDVRHHYARNEFKKRGGEGGGSAAFKQKKKNRSPRQSRGVLGNLNQVDEG